MGAKRKTPRLNAMAEHYQMSSIPPLFCFLVVMQNRLFVRLSVRPSVRLSGHAARFVFPLFLLGALYARNLVQPSSYLYRDYL